MAPYMRGLGQTPVSAVGMVPYGSEGILLPRRYAVEIDDPDCPVLVELHVEMIDDQPRCSELRLRPKPEGPTVMSENLRQIPLAKYLRESTAMYSMRIEFDDEGEVLFAQATGSSDIPPLARAGNRRQRRQITDEFLRQVAKVYTANVRSKPTLAVMRHFPTSRATASRWVAAARERYPEMFESTEPEEREDES